MTSAKSTTLYEGMHYFTKVRIICVREASNYCHIGKTVHPIEAIDIGMFSQVLTCKVGALPTTYLGLPLGASNNDIVGWNLVLQRVEKRLAGRQKNTWQKEEKRCLLRAFYGVYPLGSCLCFRLQLRSQENKRGTFFGMGRMGKKDFTWCTGRLSLLLKHGEVSE